MGGLIGALALAAAVGAASAPAADPLTTEFRARDQALIDAIAVGGRAVWDAALAPDAVYVDENGEILDRKALLDQIVPLPANVTGHSVVTDYALRRRGGTALVIFTDEETEVFHGQTLHARYRMTETWLRSRAGWKLSLAHSIALNRDPPAVTLTLAQLAAYVGRYAAAPDYVYAITVKDGQLMGGREGAAAAPLLVETGDVLFSPGKPRSRKLMQRDAAGRVTGFLDRREGTDIVWTRLPG